VQIYLLIYKQTEHKPHLFKFIQNSKYIMHTKNSSKNWNYYRNNLTDELMFDKLLISLNVMKSPTYSYPVVMAMHAK